MEAVACVVVGGVADVGEGSGIAADAGLGLALDVAGLLGCIRATSAKKSSSAAASAAAIFASSIPDAEGTCSIIWEDPVRVEEIVVVPVQCSAVQPAVAGQVRYEPSGPVCLFGQLDVYSSVAGEPGAPTPDRVGDTAGAVYVPLATVG